MNAAPDLVARIAELERSRDEWKGVADYWREQCMSARMERDKVAAVLADRIEADR